MAALHSLVICALILLLVGVEVKALECFECSHFDGSNENPECVNNPTKLTTCPDSSNCFSMGQRKTDSMDYMAFKRGCQEGPVSNWTCEVTGVIDKCTYVCDWEKCNGMNRIYTTTTINPSDITTIEPLTCFSCSATGIHDPTHCKEVNSLTREQSCSKMRKCRTITRMTLEAIPNFIEVERNCDDQGACGCTISANEKTCKSWCEGYLCNNDPWEDNMNPKCGDQSDSDGSGTGEVRVCLSLFWALSIFSLTSFARGI